MKRQGGFTGFELLIGAVCLVAVIGWCMNIYKLTQCDFKAPYKAEIIRSVGIFPPAGAVLGWINIDDGAE